MRRRVAVVGAGWAGLSAAVRSVQQGAEVTVYELSATAGGRARSLPAGGVPFDNGQHILIGAYTAALELMRTVGALPEASLWRGPLSLIGPDGTGLRWVGPHPTLAFLRGVLGHRHWTWPNRMALLRTAARWRRQGFVCAPDRTVAQLCAGLPDPVLQQLIDPLCVAALNTPMQQACGRTFLRVLHDALLSGPGSADLLLPRVPLSALLPAPALFWLQQHGATLHLGTPVRAIAPHGQGWTVDQLPFDQVVLACGARASARLVTDVAPDWAAQAWALPHTAIATVWLRGGPPALPHPMVMLPATPAGPAQFVFDLGALQGLAGTTAWVASAADGWLEQGLDGLCAAVLQQARTVFPEQFLSHDAVWHRTVERRATFACTPGLDRPPMEIARGLLAAGDHVVGPYPATLEAAVRAGLAAADTLAAT